MQPLWLWHKLYILIAPNRTWTKINNLVRMFTTINAYIVYRNVYSGRTFRMESINLFLLVCESLLYPVWSPITPPIPPQPPNHRLRWCVTSATCCEDTSRMRKLFSCPVTADWKATSVFLWSGAPSSVNSTEFFLQRPTSAKICAWEGRSVKSWTKSKIIKPGLWY